MKLPPELISVAEPFITGAIRGEPAGKPAVETPGCHGVGELLRAPLAKSRGGEICVGLEVVPAVVESDPLIGVDPRPGGAKELMFSERGVRAGGAWARACVEEMLLANPPTPVMVPGMTAPTAACGEKCPARFPA